MGRSARTACTIREHSDMRPTIIKDYEPVLSFSDEESARFHDKRGDEAVAVAFLKTLAGKGPALELAIGTGRIAVPLAAEGIQVDGIDFSEKMVERLRAKEGGQLSVQIADFADVPVTGNYSLIYLVWNSLFNLLTQNDQVRCFKNVATHLTKDGSFVVEAFVPTFLHRLHDEAWTARRPPAGRTSSRARTPAPSRSTRRWWRT